MKPLYQIAIIFLIQTQLLFAQENEVLFISDILEAAIQASPETEVIFSNKTLSAGNLKYQYLNEFLDFKYGDQLLLEDGKININVPILIRNCTVDTLLLNRISFNKKLNFKDCVFRGNVTLNNSRFSEFIIEDCTIPDIIIEECEFDDYLIYEWNHINNIQIKASEFYGLTKLVNYVNESIIIENAIFFPQRFPCTILSDSVGYDRKIHDNLQLSIGNIGNRTIDRIHIRNSDFYSNEATNKVAIRSDLNQLYMEGNFFRSSLDLSNTTIEKRLIIRNNTFESFIGFNDVIFSELFNIIDWYQFAGFKLCVYEILPEEIQYECPPNYGKFKRISDLNSILYLAEKEEELANMDSYNLLISIYQRLYNIYKTNGDIHSANGCYSEMKNVQSRMLRYRFRESRTFNNFFRWKLAQLLKIYVDHGTDPARAITISVYVIIIFAFFYFLFPSDWDITSKSDLIREFTSFLRRNSRSDLKHFLMVTWGLFLSLLNAITLSLNAFTTLGFGNIPTRGAARYICIIQGFIGWFLLSIFTVALINQVLG